MIMEMILEVTQTQSEAETELAKNIRVAAYQCIVEICSSYYDHLAKYISHIYQVCSRCCLLLLKLLVCKSVFLWECLCRWGV